MSGSFPRDFVRSRIGWRSAYIYTFDSLGSRHPGAASKLANYLRFEAMDKKGLQMEETRLAVVKQAKVYLIAHPFALPW